MRENSYPGSNEGSVFTSVSGQLLLHGMDGRNAFSPPCCNIERSHQQPPVLVPEEYATVVSDDSAATPKIRSRRSSGHGPISREPQTFGEILQASLNLDSEELMCLCQSILLARPEVLAQLCKSTRVGDTMREAWACVPAPAACPETRTELIDACKPTELQVNTVSHPGELNTSAHVGDWSTDTHMVRRSTMSSIGYVDEEGPIIDQHRMYLLHSVVDRDARRYGKEESQPVPLVQFSSAEVYCKEDDGIVRVGVMRIGALDRESRVLYDTKDASAIGGKKYIATSGELVFGPGQRFKEIEVELVDDDCWDATVEFKVNLIAGEHVVLGKALCYVKIIDDDTFPTNHGKAQIQSGQLGKLNRLRLLTEYFKMNLTNDIVRRGSIKLLLVDQLNNLYFVYCLFLELYLMEKVLCKDCTSDDPSLRMKTLLIVAVLRIVPYPFLHYLAWKSVFWRVAGTSRKTLQSNLLRKFLNYTDCSREKVDESRLIMAMSRDAGELVELGFMRGMPLIGNITRLVLVVLFQAFRDQMLGQEVDDIRPIDYVLRLAPAFLFPVFFAVFLKLRNPLTMKYLEMAKSMQNDMLHKVKDILLNYDIIRDYDRKSLVSEMYDAKITKYNKAFIDSSSIVVNNRSFAPCLTMILLVFYTYYGGAQVGMGLTLGKFISTMQVYQAIGEMWGQVYDILLEMQSTFEALSTVVDYMNLPVDVVDRMVIRRRMHELSESSVQDMLDDKAYVQDLGSLDVADKLCVEFRALHFKFKHAGALTCELRGISAAMVQGGFYALVGPPSQGKGTLLKLLCGVILPSIPGGTSSVLCTGSGDIVVPTHLRILNVLSTPRFIEGTLLANLLWGVEPGSEEGHIERIVSICRMLGVSEHTILTIEKNETVCDWIQTLSGTEASLLHIARGLVSNPEILCIHKPTLYLNSELGENLYKVLREFVENRGLCMGTNDFYRRRPRTCIVTSRSVALASIADAAYHVSGGRMQIMVRDAEGQWKLPERDPFVNTPADIPVRPKLRSTPSML